MTSRRDMVATGFALVLLVYVSGAGCGGRTEVTGTGIETGGTGGMGGTGGTGGVSGGGGITGGGGIGGGGGTHSGGAGGTSTGGAGGTSTGGAGGSTGGAAGAAGAGGKAGGGGAAGAGGGTGGTGGSPSVQVLCGASTPGTPQTCTSPPDVCCLPYTLQGGSCVGNPNACRNGSVISCTTGAECPQGQVCCGTKIQVTVQGQSQTRYDTIVCKTTCDTAGNDVVFCSSSDTAHPCPQTRPTCRPSQLLPRGYDVCQ